VTSLLLEILDSGEAEAIALAMSLGPRIPVVLDDLRARRVAEEIGLVVTGTAGILVQAKGMGLIPAFGPMLTELRAVGLYLSDSAIERLLQLANER
jgi:predicted nucleic acid-binding protein